MASGKKTFGLLRIISILCFLVAMSSCVMGTMTYGSAIRRTSQTELLMWAFISPRLVRYSFLLDKDGYVISPDGVSVPVAEAEGLDEEASELLVTSDGSVFERNRAYYTGAKVESTGWTLCIHAPADLTLSTVRTIDNDIIVAIIAFVLVFGIIFFAVASIIRSFAASIADPIIALVRMWPRSVTAIWTIRHRSGRTMRWESLRGT